jgi:transcriptional regulator of arginine metabolism
MKAERHAIILDVIEKQTVQTQEELADILRNRGISVTQATVSRDIKELRLIKVLSENGIYRYASVGKAERGMTERFIRIFTESVLSMNSAVNIVVIKTLTGSANAAAEAIDALNWPEIVGTLAGDNTIMVVVKTAEVVPEVMRRFRSMMK